MNAAIVRCGGDGHPSGAPPLDGDPPIELFRGSRVPGRAVDQAGVVGLRARGRRDDKVLVAHRARSHDPPLPAPVAKRQADVMDLASRAAVRVAAERRHAGKEPRRARNRVTDCPSRLAALDHHDPWRGREQRIAYGGRSGRGGREGRGVCHRVAARTAARHCKQAQTQPTRKEPPSHQRHSASKEWPEYGGSGATLVTASG
jgi:hypothetical protein